MVHLNTALLILVFMIPSVANAGAVIEYIDHEHLEVYVEENEPNYNLGDLILCRGSDNSVIGYGEVSSAQNDQRHAILKVLFHEHEKMVIPGDSTEHPDYRFRMPELEGRHDLLIRGKGYAAFYKRLPSFGSAMSFGHVLDQHEWLFDLAGIIQYGITHKVTVDTQVLYAFLGVASAEVKVEAYDNESFTLTTGLAYGLHPSGEQQTVLFRNLLSFKSYSKLRSYTLVTIAFKPGGGIGNSIEQSEIDGGYEYLFANWNRLLFGPSYNIDQKAIGAFLTHVWIWKDWYVLTGFKSQNLFKLKLGPDGYVPNLSVMFRI